MLEILAQAHYLAQLPLQLEQHQKEFVFRLMEKMFM